VEKFCENLQRQMQDALPPYSALELSSTAQAYLITKIHPWQDGNKRTSRLLSNYIQKYYGLPLGKVEKEDSAEYLQCLKVFKYDDDMKPFIAFMNDRYFSLLQQEITAYKEAHKENVVKNNTKTEKLINRSTNTARKRGFRM
jgi:Fic family protein